MTGPILTPQLFLFKTPSFPIKTAVFPIQTSVFPIKNSVFPITTSIFPIKTAVFPINILIGGVPFEIQMDEDSSSTNLSGYYEILIHPNPKLAFTV